MKGSLSRRIVFIALLFGAVISTAAIADKRLTIATGPTGGVYHPLGAAVAKVLASNIPDITAGHEATSASADNIRLIVAGQADIAFSQADTAWDGYKGYGKFEQPQPIRAIAVLYPNNLQIVTLRDSGIKKIEDLRGKRVSLGAKGSGTEIWGSRVLEASGLDPDKDIVRSSLAVSPSAEALKKKEIDAFVWSGGVPTKAIADLAKEPDVKIQLLNTAAPVGKMLRKYGPVYTDGLIPIYSESQIATNSYFGTTAPVKVARVWNLLVVKADMDEKLVYSIVKALFEHQDELVAGHTEARNIELAQQARGTSPIPFQPGAKKYFTEKGLKVPK